MDKEKKIPNTPGRPVTSYQPKYSLGYFRDMAALAESLGQQKKIFTRKFSREEFIAVQRILKTQGGELLSKLSDPAYYIGEEWPQGCIDKVKPELFIYLSITGVRFFFYTTEPERYDLEDLSQLEELLIN